MTLRATLAANLSASYTGSRGSVSGSGSLAQATTIALSDGTAAGQADGLFSDAGSLLAAEVVSYPLAQGLVDLYGQTLDFSAIKIIAIQADPNNTADLLVGGGSWAGPFGGGVTPIAPGELYLRARTDANGWPVVLGDDELPVTCTAQALYSLTLIGVSSEISPPAWAILPSITATPVVGQPTACNDGNYSGSPVLTYQWYVGGFPVSGARGQVANYVPLQGDLGKPIRRTTLGVNMAGATRASTAQVLVQASAPATGGGNGLSNDLSQDGLANH